MFRLLYVFVLMSLFQVAAATSPLWRLEVRRDGPVSDTLGSSVANDEARVFYVQAGQVRAVSATTGKPLWTFQVGNGAQLRYGSGRVLAVTARGKIYALEPATGQVRWARADDARADFPVYAVSDGILYIAKSKKLRAINLGTGGTKWTTRVPSFVPFEPFTFIRNRVFVFTVSGDAMNATTSIFDARSGNVACFALEQPRRTAKPDLIRVPDGEVTWLEGPYRGVFVLGWRSAVWLVRARRDDPCSPVDLLRQGNRLGPGRVARVTALGENLYVGLRSGAFYAIDARSGQVGVRLEFPAANFGPALVAGKTLVVRAGNELFAFKLPESLSR